MKLSVLWELLNQRRNELPGDTPVIIESFDDEGNPVECDIFSLRFEDNVLVLSLDPEVGDTGEEEEDDDDLWPDDPEEDDDEGREES